MPLPEASTAACCSPRWAERRTHPRAEVVVVDTIILPMHHDFMGGQLDDEEDFKKTQSNIGCLGVFLVFATIVLGVASSGISYQSCHSGKGGDGVAALLVLVTVVVGARAFVTVRWRFRRSASRKTLRVAASQANDELKHQRALEIARASAPISPAAQTPPMAQAHPPASTHTITEKIVERHVLVLRCTKCRKLTAADLSECENCGNRI